MEAKGAVYDISSRSGGGTAARATSRAFTAKEMAFARALTWGAAGILINLVYVELRQEKIEQPCVPC